VEDKFSVIDAGEGRFIKAWNNGVLFDEKAVDQLKNTAKLPFIYKYIAAMPDTHWGMGATIGTVLPTRGAVVPAAVGVDIGCFSHDTSIPLLDGNSYHIGTLAERGEDVFIWCCTDDGKITASIATPKKTRSDAKLKAVVLDDGSIVKCTPDQQFQLRDGTYHEAQNLKLGTSLMPFYSRVYEGYLHIQQPYSGREQKAHWTVARSGLIGAIPDFTPQYPIIHHKDYNGLNNLPCNLEPMGHIDHTKFHRAAKRHPAWHSEYFETKRKQALKEKAETTEGHKYFAERGTANLIKYMTERREEFLAAVAGNGKRGAPYLAKYNKSEKGREISSKVAHIVHACETCGAQVIGGFGLHNHRRWQHGYNHSVIAVLDIIGSSEDVYCLTVPKYHNFAISAGVFVHNCGMIAEKTGLQREHFEDLAKIRAAIETAVPCGRTNNGGKGDRGAWGVVPEAYQKKWDGEFAEKYEDLCTRHAGMRAKNTANHFGTLGTGNHFIELTTDEDNNVWLVLHSGSRGMGNKIGNYFTELAQEMCAKFFVNLPDPQLAYLPERTDEFKDYRHAVTLAQDFAWQNRLFMVEAIYKALEEIGIKMQHAQTVHCHHNYIAWEHHFGENVIVTRKGAVRARETDMGIIPGSMGARTYIVKGLGNKHSFHTCSHGAGRAMSRREAERRFTVEDHIKATEGIECAKDASVLDETPGAYKDIETVMAAQSDLVEPVYRLKQFICVKGGKD